VIKMQVSFSAEKELIARIEEIAQKTERSRSATIAMLLNVAVRIAGDGKIRLAAEPTTGQLLQMIRDMAERFQKRFEEIERKLEAT
jgi:predicted transcriptional regulator